MTRKEFVSRELVELQTCKGLAKVHVSECRRLLQNILMNRNVEADVDDYMKALWMAKHGEKDHAKTGR